MNHRYELRHEPRGAVTHVIRIATAGNTLAGLGHEGFGLHGAGTPRAP